MNADTIDSGLVLSWLTARSIARELPLPMPDHGGFRVDTASETEICRWLFPAACDGLSALGRSIVSPGYFLKLCGTGRELATALPAVWQLQPSGYFMTAAKLPDRETKLLPQEYSLNCRTEGATTFVRITTPDGSLAASGYAAETANAFVYGRIQTAPQHRRLGLGNIVMTALASARKQSEIPELLVATEDGHKLYITLGWRILSPYCTATIPA